MMTMRAFRRSGAVLLRGVILLASAAALCYRAGLNSASTALVFLIVVVLQSLDSSFFEAAVLSVLAVAGLDYFFIEPPFSFAVAHPLDVVTLACLLTTSLLITRIQAISRKEAREARFQRENMERLYKVGQQLLALAPETGLSPGVLKPILAVFDLTAVCIFDGTTLESHEVGASSKDLKAKTREAYISGHDTECDESGIAVLCLRTANTVAGAIGFEGLKDPALTAPPLATLAAEALERARAFRSARDAAAHADAEILRSAILDALAHEFKTPLATILTAAGGMRATGAMQPEQAELADLIETEASRLGDLTSRLLRMARLDGEDVRPRLEPADPSELAELSARRYSRLWPDRRISFRKPGEIGEIPVDPELILLAISQLIENACRYSRPDANILIEATAEGNGAAITVLNDGVPIPESERSRIFDRFYRGKDARRSAPGSGLGLYVARKIAVAHGGDITLIDTHKDAVAFRLSIPFVASGACVDE